MILLTKNQDKKYKKQKRYHIYKEEFNENEKHSKAPDHCHYAGKFRGAIHNMCNLII